MHLGLKRNFQVMPGAEWLKLLGRDIPDRYEHLVRYPELGRHAAELRRCKKFARETTISLLPK